MGNPPTTAELAAAFDVGRWRARWIWTGEATEDRRRVVALRTVLELDDVPSVVPARVAAIARYALAVNGEEVRRGPARGNPRMLRYDVIDLAPVLRSGPNVVAALVTVYRGANPFWLPGPPFASRLGSGGFLLEAAPGPVDLRTDGSWSAALLDGWTDGSGRVGISGRPREVLDLRSLARDWASDPAVGTWTPAIEVDGRGHGESGRLEPPNHPYGPFGPNEVTPLTRDEIAGVTAPDGGVRFDRVVVGTLVVDVEGPAGTAVHLTAVERTGDGEPVADQEPIGVDVVLDGGRRAVESFDVYGVSELGVEVDDPAAVVHGVRVIERRFPVAGDASFACSDPLLDEIWRVGRRTVTICSLDAYVDCPTREQRAWAGDSVVHQLVDLTTDADWSLARWHPRLAASPRPDGMLPMAVAGDAEDADFTMIPDWALHWIHSVHNLYRYVGDREEVRRLLPVVENVLRWFDPFVDRHGTLTDVIGWVIIDWASVGTDGVCGPLNGLYGRALLELAEMSDWLGDAGRAGWARAAHARLVEGFERLWDPQRERYVDSLVPGRDRPMASQHGQAAAIVGGLAPRHRWPRLVEVLTDEADLVHATFAIPDGEATPGGNVSPGGAYLRQGHPDPWWDVERQVVRAQPFFRYVVHDALATAGRADLVAGLCRDWRWALERCATSWTETWFGGTVSHGWSSTPTRDLVVRVLGVEPAEPGFGRVRIEPALGDLAWARGRVPCPAGWIDVSVDADTIEVTSPIPVAAGGSWYEAGSHAIARTGAPGGTAPG